MNSGLEDAFFPDPKPEVIPLTSSNNQDQTYGIEHDGNPKSRNDNSAHVHLNDVSRMSAYPNGTPVSKVFFPRCEADVLDIVQAAHSAKKQIGIRGTKHSMGYVLITRLHA